jgi:hypothetical protein
MLCLVTAVSDLNNPNAIQYRKLMLHDEIHSVLVNPLNTQNNFSFAQNAMNFKCLLLFYHIICHLLKLRVVPWQFEVLTVLFTNQKFVFELIFSSLRFFIFPTCLAFYRVGFLLQSLMDFQYCFSSFTRVL